MIFTTMFMHALLPKCLPANNTYYQIRTPFTVSFLVGTIGHVAHGKSTVVKAISGVQVCSIVYYYYCLYIYIKC